jgi:hypothetical protein
MELDSITITDVKNVRGPDSDGFSIFPNPASNTFTITAAYPITKLAITNPLGQVVQSQTCNAIKISVDITNLVSDVYFIRINDMQVGKFVKQ